MDTTIIINLVFLAILILLSGFFSASETALLSLNKIRLKYMIENNVKNAKIIESLLEKPDRLLSSILLGNNAVNIAATSVATALAISLFPRDVNKGVAYVTVVMTILILLFGEITPKNIAVQFSEKISIFVSKPILILSKLFSPILYVLTIITNFIFKILGIDNSSKKPFITHEELKTIVDVSNQEGILETDEKEMIYNIFEFSDLRIRDVMIQRMDIQAIPTTATYHEVVEMFKTNKFSRLPVYDDTIDNIVGILYSKDLFLKDLDEDFDKDHFNVIENMRDPFTTFEFIKISDFFKQMQGNQNHLAIVLDEYGGVAGLVTMENIIESIFGDINDEYDEIAGSDVEAVKDNEFVLNANIRLEELNDMVGTNFMSEEFESIGGFIIGIVGKLPKEGDIIEYGSYKFIIENVEKNRINKIRMHT